MRALPGLPPSFESARLDLINTAHALRASSEYALAKAA